jgi:dipeptidase E
VSAGATALIGETYKDPPAGIAQPLTSEEVVFRSPGGDLTRPFVTSVGAGLVHVSLIPHLDNPNHPDASSSNAPQWAGRLPVITYALDDQIALKMVEGEVTVVSEGHWLRFEPA